MDYSRPSRVASALWKRCATDQFVLRPFRGARLRNAHVSRGGFDHYSVMPGCGKATKERRQENRGIGCYTSYSCCARCGRGIAHGVFPHALVVCNDHRGLCSECIADRHYLLPDASVAPAHHRRQDAYFDNGERSPTNEARRFSLLGCADIWAGSRRSSCHRGADPSCHRNHCFSNPGHEVLYQQTIGLCRIDFNCRTRCRLCLPAACSLKIPCH